MGEESERGRGERETRGDQEQDVNRESMWSKGLVYTEERSWRVGGQEGAGKGREEEEREERREGKGLKEFKVGAEGEKFWRGARTLTDL